MNRHTIELEDIKGYYFEQEIAGSYSKWEHKTIKVLCYIDTNKMTYTVFNKGVEVYRSESITDAIEKYNKY